METKEKLLKNQVEAINTHFLNNDIMTKKEYDKISSNFISEVFKLLSK